MGLVNGTGGIIASAIKTAKRVVAMLVEFADVSTGLAAIQRSHYSQKQFNMQSIVLSNVLKSQETNSPLF